MQTKNKKLDFLFLFMLMTVLIGRGFFLLIWDVSYRAILWDERLLSPLVNFFGSWESWVSSPLLDQSIEIFIRVQGVSLILCALMAFTKYKKAFHGLLFLSSFHLFLLAVAGFWQSHFQWGYFFEYTLQMMAPICFYLWRDQQYDLSKKLLLLSTGLTFFAHGLYALGYYQTPGRFVDMLLATLSLKEATALMVLKGAGTFDIFFFLIVLAFLLFKDKFSKASLPTFLLLATFWGLSTASARWVAYVEWEFLGQSLLVWAPEVMFRLVHGLAPLWLFFALKSEQKTAYQQTPLTASILSV